jgi:dephospho-CoA kinase
MVRVGLTGGIASGKTAVSRLLEEHGALVIDADVLAREVVAPGTHGLSAVVDRFSPAVLAPDGSLDRAALGQTVFADPTARRDLEAIIHPAVRARAAEIETATPEGAVVVHVIPLLVETGQQDAFDICVVVDVDVDTQIERICRRNGLSRAEAEARVAAQASRADRLAVADVVIDNSGTRRSLEAQVRRLWHDLTAKATLS